MKMQTFVIFDSKAKIYNKPFYFVNDQVAYRSAVDLLQGEKNDIQRNPTDFSMFKLGIYDDETASFEYKKEHFISFHEIQIPINFEEKPTEITEKSYQVKEAQS